MIPSIETLLVEELERRIVAAMPETAPSEDGEPETFVTTFESRTFKPCLQEQENLVVYGKVEAELSVIFYTQKTRNDFTRLYVSLAKNPHLHTDGMAASIEFKKCEAVEGPYLSNDAWLFSVTYFIFETVEVQDWQPPRIDTSDASARDIYPRPEPDLRSEPEAHV